MVQLLIKHLANPQMEDVLGRKPVDLAMAGAVADTLLEHEKDWEARSMDTAPTINIDEEGIYDFELEAPKEPTKTV